MVSAASRVSLAGLGILLSLESCHFIEIEIVSVGVALGLHPIQFLSLCFGCRRVDDNVDASAHDVRLDFEQRCFQIFAISRFAAYAKAGLEIAHGVRDPVLRGAKVTVVHVGFRACGAGVEVGSALGSL
jgi:hypothetical protein